MSDGSYVGSADFYVIPYWFGGVAALIALVLGHYVFWRLAIAEDRNRELASAFKEGSLGKYSQAWFSDNSGVPSLSIFQIYLWTWLVIGGLTYVFVLTGELFALNQQVLVLLGIAGLGSIAAQVATRLTGQRKPPSNNPRFSDILRTDGKLDSYRLQMFLFTILIAGFVAVRIAIDEAFPPLETSLLLLMGISNGIYVGSKAVASDDPLQTALRLDFQLKVLTVAKDSADAELKRITEEKAKIDDDLKLNPNDDALKVKQGTNAMELKNTTEKAAKAKKDLDDTIAAYKTAVAAYKTSVEALGK